MRRRRIALMTCALATVAAASSALAACDRSEPEPEPWVWALPPGFPEPAVPDDNPMSAAKVELGRHLFYDKRLSGNQTLSCAGCHDQALGFSDGKALPTGSTGDTVPRSAMALANVAYMPTYTWANPNLLTLEEQARVPIFAEAPVELGATGHEEEILGRFRGDDDYVARFADAFPDDEAPINFDNIVRSIAAFERSMISADTPYDRYFYGGEVDALSPAAQRGLALFFSERLECYHCHGGLNLTAAFYGAESVQRERAYFNNGLYNLDGAGAYPEPNVGLFAFTGEAADMGRFRAPTLRNIALSGPYMHDGSVATLEDVIDFYAAGGRDLSEGPYAGDGTMNPYKDPLVRGFMITDDEKADVIAFLESFTDETFLADPAFADPFAQ